MSFIILLLLISPFKAFSQNFKVLSPKQLKLQEQITIATNILNSHQSLTTSSVLSLPLNDDNKITSYKQLLKIDEQTVILSQKLNDSLTNDYKALKQAEPYIYLLNQLEQTQKELFEDFTQLALNNNQNHDLQNNFTQDHLVIKYQKGRLTYEELSFFIQLEAQKNPQPPAVKEFLKQTTDLISLAYKAIDTQKAELINNSYFLAYLLCDSQVYRSAYKGDCFFTLNNKSELIDFLNSVSPSKWQELNQIFKNTGEYKNYSKYFDSSLSLNESLWILYNQDFIYDSYNQAWKQADFYRWLYFILREKAKQGVKNISWDELLNHLNEEKQTVDEIISQEIDFLVNDSLIREEKSKISAQLLQTRGEYFKTLNTVTDFFTKITFNEDSNCEDFSIITKRNLCFDEILNFISNQEEQQTDLKNKIDNNKKAIIFYAPHILNELKNQLNSQ